jgi:hypothetical protein
MDPIAAQISRISEKVSLLVKEYRNLQRENERLRHELERKSGVLAELAGKYADLEREADILKVSSVPADGYPAKDMERIIEQYIRDIDRCIAKLEE